MKLQIIAIALCMSCGATKADVLVFAAASLKEPVDAVADGFEDVVVSYGGSGTMARQVSLGAPADVILLANDEWMHVLVTNGHVAPESVIEFASNSLVLIAPAGSADVPLQAPPMLQALNGGRIATGLTTAVPAGIYAKAALQSLELWTSLQNQLAEVDNVRAALALVARGQSPVGIVYTSDARGSPAVEVVATFPADSHPTFRYQAALTKNAGPEAAAFLAALTGAVGQEHLADAGFLPSVVAR